MDIYVPQTSSNACFGCVFHVFVGVREWRIRSWGEEGTGLAGTGARGGSGCLGSEVSLRNGGIYAPPSVAAIKNKGKQVCFPAAAPLAQSTV